MAKNKVAPFFPGHGVYGLLQLMDFLPIIYVLQFPEILECHSRSLKMVHCDKLTTSHPISKRPQFIQAQISDLFHK